MNIYKDQKETKEEKNSLLGWGIVGRPLTCNEYFFVSLYIVLYHETAKTVLLVTSNNCITNIALSFYTTHYFPPVNDWMFTKIYWVLAMCTELPKMYRI